MDFIDLYIGLFCVNFQSGAREAVQALFTCICRGKISARLFVGKLNESGPPL